MIIKKTSTSTREFDEQQKEIYKITNKLISEFTNNCLVREFVHDCNKRINELNIISKLPNPYIIDDSLYSYHDISEFLLIFISKFPFHLYKKYGVFKPSDDGYFRITFKFKGNDIKDSITFRIKDETFEPVKTYPRLKGVFVNLMKGCCE